jgi:hypothetical protein
MTMSNESPKHTPQFSDGELTDEKYKLRRLLERTDNMWEAVEEFSSNKKADLDNALKKVALQTLQGEVPGSNPDMVSQAIKIQLLNAKRERSV